MSLDTEDNGIPVLAPEMEETIEGIDLSLEDFVTPVLSKGERGGNAFMSTQLSSASWTSKMSGIFSMDSQPLPQPAVFGVQESLASWTRMPDNLQPSPIASFSGRFGDIVGAFDSLGNSTLSYLGSTNETKIHSPSSWSAEEIGAVVIVSLMVPFILLSNICVIICIVRFRRLHTPTNYFISSLASVDIFVAVATPFGIVVEVFNFGGAVGPDDVVLCLLPNRILMMACGVSVLTLATIAFDRYKALVSPMDYVNIMTRRKVAIMVSVTWIYSSFIVWLPLFIGWYSLPSEADPCSANLIHGKAPVLFLSAIFAPSCLVIFICYFRIFMVARHHAKAIAAVEFAVHRNLQVRFMLKDTKYAKTLAMVIGAFLLLWLPYLIFIFVQTVCATRFNIWVQTYLILLTVFNSGINPWIYAFKNNELRAAFKRLFREICRTKVCISADKRASLVSAVSGTPRLSRTDSRIASIVPEVSTYIVNEKLKRSLDSLDEQMIERQRDLRESQQRFQTSIEEASSPPSHGCLKQSLRQAASCSDLNIVKDKDPMKQKSSVRSRSLSVDFTLANDSLEDAETCNSHEMCNNLLTREEHVSRRCSFGSSVTTDNHYQCNTTNYSRSCSLSSNTSAISSPLTLLSPLSPYHRQSSSTPTYPSTFLFTNHVSEPVQLQNTTASIGALPVTPHQHLRHTYSLDHLQDALPPTVFWGSDYCPNSFTGSTFHPHHQNFHTSNFSDLGASPESHTPHILTHTHSCPILDPITSYQYIYPQMWGGNIIPSHHKIVSVSVHEPHLDFVTLVNRETEHSCSSRHLV